MSSLTDLLLRINIDANYQTKGVTLTWEEVDANFQLIADVLRENILNINPGGIDAYDNATEYSLGVYVSYSNNLWEYVYPTPSTGNAPVIGSVYWEIRSAGALAHQQNTDTHTNKNRFGIGDGENVNRFKELFARNGEYADGAEPRIRFNGNLDVWEVSHDGVNFSGLGSKGAQVVDSTDIGGTNLDMAGQTSGVFKASDPYTVTGSNTSLEILNASNALRVTFIFEITAGVTLALMAEAKMADVRFNNVAKHWVPYDTGTYKAEFTWDGTYWLVDISQSPYI